MAVIKQKTVGDRTIQLRRGQTEKAGKQYEYFATDDTDSLPLTQPVYTKEEGMQDFREQVTEADMDLAESRGQESFDRDNTNGGGGLLGGALGGPSGGGGGGGPTIPGMGGPARTDDDEDDDDDDGPYLPFM